MKARQGKVKHRLTQHDAPLPIHSGTKPIRAQPTCAPTTKVPATPQGVVAAAVVVVAGVVLVLVKAGMVVVQPDVVQGQ